MLAPESSLITSFQQELPVDLPDPVGPEPAAGQPGEVRRRGWSAGRPGFGLLMALCPAAIVDRVVAEHGRKECRERLLPARIVVYVLLMMAMCPDLS